MQVKKENGFMFWCMLDQALSDTLLLIILKKMKKDFAIYD